jgi:hypothetical protein
MLAIHAKQGIQATLERVFKHSGFTFRNLDFLWNSNSAGVLFSRNSNFIDASFMMPAVDDQAEVSRVVYNHWLGFMLHELGHVWFTDSEAWDAAVEAKGDKYLHALINGLEDPRIERAVIDRDNNNASNLFQNLVNAMVERDGEVSPDDFKNIPFMLAIEGRRLNGYRLAHKAILPTCPWADILEPALLGAKSAKSTQEVVEIAEDLYSKLKQSKQKESPEPQKNASSESQEDQGESSKTKKEPSLGKPTRQIEPDNFIEGTCEKVGLQTKPRPDSKLGSLITFKFV